MNKYKEGVGSMSRGELFIHSSAVEGRKTKHERKHVFGVVCVQMKISNFNSKIGSFHFNPKG